jgi:hypothetical protein
VKRPDPQKIALWLWILFSIFFCLESLKLEIGRPSRPGPGFMPLLIGIFMGTTSLITLLTMIWTKKEISRERRDDRLFASVHLRKPLLVYVAVATYALTLNSFGYLISTFFLMFFLFKYIEPQKMLTALLATILTVCFSYLIFVVWLGCQFPPFPTL